MAGTDRLTSVDGQSWTLDYGDRPLARFEGGAAQQLFWSRPDGRHDLFLRVASATISRSGLGVRFAWRFGPGRDEDPYFDWSRIGITSLTLDGRQVDLTLEPATTIGSTTRNGTAFLAGSFKIPRRIGIQVDVSPRIDGGGGGRATVETSFELAPPG
jgi:hypothetical protein